MVLHVIDMKIMVNKRKRSRMEGGEPKTQGDSQGRYIHTSGRAKTER